MRSRLAIILLGVVFASAASPIAAGQDKSGEAAERRARELVRLIDSGDAKAARAYVQENYGADFLGRAPLDFHVSFLLGLHDRSRGVEIEGVEHPAADQAVVMMRAKLTGQRRGLFVAVENAPPHKITGIGLRPAPAAQSATRKLTDEEIVRELEAFVKKLADADVFSGAVLLARDGRVLWAGAYGAANKDFGVPNRVDTKFNLGSMNKMFTAVAIAQLVERGKLSFDDPLSKFLPEFPNAADAQKIKLKHLLTHTSGLGSYFNREFDESSRARYRTVDDMLALAKDEKLQFEPGTRWAYSNTGMLVLGAVVEKVTGQSYFDYIRENVYKPAGMVNSDSYELDRVTPNLAVGYDKEYTDDGVRFRNNIFAHVIRGGPAGGGYSTVEDLLRFDQALRSHKLVGAELTKALLTPKPEVSSPEYGYGFGIFPGEIVGHSGGFTGISSNLDIFLGSGYTAVVMSNYSAASQPVVAKVRELVSTAKR